MESNQALTAFSALSQHTRLEVFRLLIKAGSGGMTPGQLSETLGTLQNTLSTNLNILVNAGLVQRSRQGRSIRYFVNVDGVRGLLAFLMRDCCGGRPELCELVVAEIAGNC